jgi:hypothetical protein
MPESIDSQSVNHVDDLVENALRCYRLALAMSNTEFSRRLGSLGQEYAAAAIAWGADPANLPSTEEWRAAAV